MGYVNLALVFNDQEADWPDNSISIGDVDNYDNDDFEIGVTGNKVYAIGFMMQSNGDDPTEFLDVWAAQDECYLDQKDLPTIINGFVGVVSPVPLNRIFFNEDEGIDDIGIRDFFFGYRTD